jgi:hypothetical protein
MSEGDPKILSGSLREILRDQPDAASELVTMMSDCLRDHAEELSAAQKEGIEKALTYYENHEGLMDYAEWRELKRPIGSGVTEAACKVIIKQRMTRSGMAWSVSNADAILQLRALYRSPARWEAFWKEYAKRTKQRAMT